MIEKAIGELGAAGPRDIGKVMKQVMGELRGRADGRQVNALVTAALQALGAKSERSQDPKEA